MLGWEFPPLVHGGLGVASHGLATALAARLPLSLLLPHPIPAPGISHLPLGPRHEAALLSPAIAVASDLTPYLDAPPSSPDTPDLYGADLPARVVDFARRAAAAANGVTFDLIHAHDWLTALAGLEIRARTGKPLVFHIHSLGFDRAGPHERDWIHDLECRIIREADLVISVSHRTRRTALDHYGACPGKIVVVHNGVIPVSPFRSPKPFPEKLVVFLGRLTEQKGPRHFLEIARQVLATNPQVRFAMAGEGEQLRQLMSDARRLGIDHAFHFTGFLDRRKVRHLFSMADAYCMPSTSEPFGLSALEAAQFGLPLVLSRESGAAEILPHARTAPASDTMALARHLLEVLAGQATTGPKKMRSWDEAAREILTHYRSLHAPES
jgi:glycosyltransferase involved in cell wall biosynthesis